MNNRENRLLFIYTETPLHAGSGRSLGYVDLPIQRERTTNYPMIQSSSLKGRLRAEVRREKGWYKNGEDTAELKAIFGDADDGGNSYAGAVTPGDARVLLFPVRSLQGVFAWVTSLDVLSRFRRDARALGFTDANWELPAEPQTNDDETLCYAGDKVIFQNQVTLEEFTYRANKHEIVGTIACWLAKNALPQTDDYKYWRENLAGHLVILPCEDFRDFVTFGTEVRTHIAIQPDTKTVAGSALWTVESLPGDTLLYAPLIINDSRAQVDNKQSAADIATILHDILHDQRRQLGGHETTGQGVVMLHTCQPEKEETDG